MPTLCLPFPVSTNALWRHGKGKTYISPKYKAWKDAALVAYLSHEPNERRKVNGHFAYHITLDERKRKQARDGDNRGKCVLDFLQYVGVIEDDKLADSGSWSWGPVEGCMVRVFPKPNPEGE